MRTVDKLLHAAGLGAQAAQGVLMFALANDLPWARSTPWWIFILLPVVAGSAQVVTRSVINSYESYPPFPPPPVPYPAHLPAKDPSSRRS